MGRPWLPDGEFMRKQSFVLACSVALSLLGTGPARSENLLEVYQAAIKNDTSYVASECPLAADHLMQVMELTAGDQTLKLSRANHPIELMALAYGLTVKP